MGIKSEALMEIVRCGELGKVRNKLWIENEDKGTEW